LAGGQEGRRAGGQGREGGREKEMESYLEDDAERV